MTQAKKFDNADSQKRIRAFLDKNLIEKKFVENNIIQTYMKNANESIAVADLLAKQQISPLWVIVTSYYSMFYSANAVLCKLGYKVGEFQSHEITKHALVVFVQDKLKKELLSQYAEEQEKALKICETLLENYNFELGKRHTFQYDMGEELKVAQANTSLERAKAFYFVFKKLLDDLSRKS